MTVTKSLILNYEKLQGTMRELLTLQSAIAIINWDLETKMPSKAITLRSHQLALLARLAHKMGTNPEIGRLLEDIRQDPEYEKLNPVQKRNVYLIKKNYDEQTSLPEDLVSEIEKQQTIARDAWKKAKAKSDFLRFKPELEKLVELKKRAADLLMEVKETAVPYDALIDIFEPKMPSVTINKIFDALGKDLRSLIGKCASARRQPDERILRTRVPIDTQRKISKAIAAFLGYDVESANAGGRIDETEHPFTMGYYDDVRITTHYYEEKFTTAIFSTLHECGHALYEQNLNPEWMFQVVGTACSMGFHEAQSRFVENILGRSHAFWSFFLPKVNELTGDIVPELASFLHAINQVKPSKIRIEADEVTYGLHIIIRFNLERDLFADKITVSELPEAWKQLYKDQLGVEIENDTEGVLQDTHWASGLFGYFPSYALGNIYCGQLAAEMEKNLPQWRHQISKGEFRETKDWLVENVYRYGNLYDPSELIQKITGEPLSVQPYLDYLNKKYTRLYGF